MKYIENIACLVRNAEKRAAINYAKTDGLLYKSIKILYIISAVISFIMSAFFVIGRMIKISEIKELAVETANNSDITAAKNSALSVGILSILFIASIVILKFKAEIISAALTLISGTASIFILMNVSKNTLEYNSGINASFWFRHFIPIVLSVIFICWLTAIKIRANIKFNTAYTNMVNRIYKDYNKDNLTEEEWAEFLENYDPRAEEEKRRREKKNQKYSLEEK